MKSFFKNFADDYPVEIVFCGGDPRLVIIDDDGNELEEFDLDDYNEKQIIDLLESKNFTRFN